VSGLDAADADFLLNDWQLHARDDQLPPQESWRTWLLLGGRGAGKTRAGAEWVRAQALGIAPLASRPAARIGIVGETMHDARSVMVEGISGLLAIHPNAERPRFEPSKAQLVWPNGAVGQLFSADDPDSLRGPQFEVAWADEIAKWKRAEDAWAMLQLAVRLGENPRIVATSTPRTVPLILELTKDPQTIVTRARTTDNRAFLAESFIASMRARYDGTALGRQELDGEIVTVADGALWRSEWFERHRLGTAPPIGRIVVAVDPPVTSTKRSDACGIVVAGLSGDGRAIVLADRTLTRAEPTTWARAAVSVYREFSADRIVAEVNQGGDLVATMLRQIDPSIALTQVRATRGKWLRAEPVAALYADGRVSHVGIHRDLEAEMLAFTVDGLAGGRSPDRTDALVWALTELLLGASGEAAIRRL
jgi:phage terminase large subunit-like protein